jgi:hypothetical protein
MLFTAIECGYREQIEAMQRLNDLFSCANQNCGTLFKFNLFVPKTVAKLYRSKACVSTGN